MKNHNNNSKEDRQLLASSGPVDSWLLVGAYGEHNGLFNNTASTEKEQITNTQLQIFPFL